jgi:phosphoglycolate phosphatase
VAHRLLLWDIDGTLVNSGGLGTAAFDRALQGVFGRLPEARVRMSGKTDPQIVREYMELLEVDDLDSLPDVLKALELELLAVEKELAAKGSAYEGAAALLARLHEDARVTQSVLTGNIAPNAVIKLAAFGLDRLLDLEAGAFGSDHADRRELVPIALARQRELRGMAFEPAETWVIGDTPNDLDCARAAGARCLLVATGRFTLDDLAPLGAEGVVPDLVDADHIVELLTAGL